jgi:hypothetical protein
LGIKNLKCAVVMAFIPSYVKNLSVDLKLVRDSHMKRHISMMAPLFYLKWILEKYVFQVRT